VILAFHCIFTAYGFWLPNEPRGSWSTFVASWELRRFGPAIKVSTRRSLAKAVYDPQQKRQMQQALKQPPVQFTGEQAKIIGDSFRNTPYVLHALAILPEHVHAVVAWMDRDIRRSVGHLKSEATRALRARGHFEHRPIWTDHGWNVYLDSDADVERAIRYVEGNPLREGKPRQRWKNVTPWDPATSRAARARRKRRG